MALSQSKIFLIIGLILALFILKPNVIFKPNGKPREHGFGLDSEGYKKTLYTVHLVVIFGAVLIHTVVKSNNRVTFFKF